MYNMEKIPTALELFQTGEFTKIQDAMIKFAKMHVEAALKEAKYCRTKECIQKCYPLDKIE